MARAVMKVSANIDPLFEVEDLARELALDCHKFAEFDFANEGNGTCPCGAFSCPFQYIDCDEVTAADWLRILEVVHD